jgi:hypothetical protein
MGDAGDEYWVSAGSLEAVIGGDRGLGVGP